MAETPGKTENTPTNPAMASASTATSTASATTSDRMSKIEDNKKKARDYYHQVTKKRNATDEVYKEKNRVRARINANKFHSFVNALKEGRPCLDCSMVYPTYVMDFDHRDPTTKISEIATMRRRHVPLEKLLAEIAKCDLICSNCHRIRTHKRRHGIE